MRRSTAFLTCAPRRKEERNITSIFRISRMFRIFFGCKS